MANAAMKIVRTTKKMSCCIIFNKASVFLQISDFKWDYFETSRFHMEGSCI